MTTGIKSSTSQRKNTKEKCWVVCDEGKVGTANQCIGLAESLGYQPEIKYVRARFPWSYLPSCLWVWPLKGLDAGKNLTPPWPQLIIGAGRVSAAPTAYIRRLSQGHTKVIYIQNPRLCPNKFDAVIAPSHDRLRACSVITTEGSLHRVTPQRLAKERKKYEAQLAYLPRPLLAVCIGGTHTRYTLTPKIASQLGHDILTLIHRDHMGVVLTFSRRTPSQIREILTQILESHAEVEIWDGQKPNPYFGYLGSADFVLVTCDSVSMISEACSTGKPVYLYPLPGGSKKFTRFHHSFSIKGYTRLFTGEKLEPWSYQPPQELRHVTKILRKKLDLNPKGAK